jgi:hypothetical protein
MARVRKVLLWVAGSVVGLSVLVLSIGFWWVSSLYQNERADSALASAAFDQVRARFAGVQPAFEIRGERLVMVREPAVPPSPAPAAHMLVWEPDNQTLSRIRLPMSMSLVATEPIPLEALAGVAHDGVGALMEARRRGNELNIRISDLERYGRTLLLDGVTAGGRHVLMWNE